MVSIDFETAYYHPLYMISRYVFLAFVGLKRFRSAQIIAAQWDIEYGVTEILGEAGPAQVNLSRPGRFQVRKAPGADLASRWWPSSGGRLVVRHIGARWTSTSPVLHIRALRDLEELKDKEVDWSVA